MTRLQAATDTLKEVALMYVAIVIAAAVIFTVSEGASLGDALYWAGTTATSTGYGDLSPKTLIGKIDAILLMHASIFFIAPMVVVRLIDKFNADRDAFTHEEQEHVKAELAAIKAAVGADLTVAYVDLDVAATKLEEDMRRYLYDKQPGRRIQCLDRYRKTRGMEPWAESSDAN